MKEQTTLMTEGVIWKQILFFSIPLILGNLFQQMYNTVDSIIVGNYVGSNALAAVGSSTSLITLLIGLSMGISMGAGVVISQNLGAGHKKNVHIAVHTSLALAIILGVILTIVGVALTPQILIWMKTPSEVMGESVTYFRFYSLGFLFSILYNMAAGILNAVGNSKRSLLYLIIASCVNVVLDLVFICGFHMGVEGAAIATDLSQLISSILAIGYLMRVNEDFKVVLTKISIQKEMAVKIIKIGLPTGLQNMVISFANVLIQSSVNGFGANAMAGFGAYLKIDGFNILPVLSIGMAATTFTGQNYGAGRIDRVKKGAITTIILELIYTIGIGIFLLLIAHPVIGLFSKDENVIQYGVLAMKYFCPFYFLLGIMYALAGTIRGTGKSVPPMVVLLIAMCLFRIVWIQTIMPFFATIDGLFVLYPVSWVLGLALMALYTWKGKWLITPEK